MAKTNQMPIGTIQEERKLGHAARCPNNCMNQTACFCYRGPPSCSAYWTPLWHPDVLCHEGCDHVKDMGLKNFRNLDCD